MRNKWTFTYLANEVAEAAKAKADHHAKRERFWTDERAKVIQAIKDSGIEIREHEITGGIRPEVVIDPTHSSRLAECQNKVREHQQESNEYEGWFQTLNAAGSRSTTSDVKGQLDLDHDDIRYFGLDQ